MTARVVITRCPSYEAHPLQEALERSLSLIGSLSEVVKPGQRVLLKINHLGQHHPRWAVNTNPHFLRAVIQLVREVTGDVVVADGLNGPGVGGFEISGTLDVCRDLDVELVNFKGAPYREVRSPDFEMVEAIPIAEAALEADVVITLPKLKTHMLCLMTNAVKNNYGFIPMRLRSNYHRQFPSPDEFSNLVTDVFSAHRPHLAIVDAIVALEGTGPSRGGAPKELGLIVAGRDCVAVDAVSAAVMGLAPADVATTRHAARRGLGETELANIEVVGESIRSVRNPFSLPASPMLIESALARMPVSIRSVLGTLVRSTREYPWVVARRCIGCGLCVEHCPMGAVRLVNGKAKIDRSQCIACFCCQEFCESDAIAVTRRPLGLAVRFARKVRRMIRRILRGRTD